MNVQLTDQVVIVTGAGRGIGREVAMVAASAGARVVLVARTEPQLQTVAQAIRAEGGQALVHACDLAVTEAAAGVVDAAIAEYGRVDVLVNNAAINYVANLVMSKDDRWRELYEVNLFAMVRLTRLVLKRMIRCKSGRIINISSVSAKVGAAYNAAYASSKAAMIGFTKSVAREVARLGITVNAVCPWHVDTEMVREAMTSRAKMFGKTTDEYLAEIIAENPQGRIMTAREMAATCVFLMSHDARGITGQAINVDGGFVMD
ncbi:SDR family NAD(P)-dependent oxidoreductase [Paraliomyxa miuraensis]|uniref:SDR family NAD(P)-dependent oxidoreductase n=1 Tax=Paraliomyxa miuraensis TaxID=376150 RepID=UPI002250C07E|nr:SDR family NAD(P)-dependent oxidoreductase [Paraliomyxa miuraensis]MCX4240780.1 SDR family oxidoreductase [Paraliomyxa miuraensis]